MLHPFAFSPSQCARIARLRRTIHQHIFSRLSGAQFTDCITCLSNTHFVLNMPVYISFPMFRIFPSQCAPRGSAEQPWTATLKSQSYYLDLQRATLVLIRLPAHIHVCFTLLHKIHTTQFRLHPPVTSAEMRKHFHTPTVALRL